MRERLLAGTTIAHIGIHNFLQYTSPFKMTPRIMGKISTIVILAFILSYATTQAQNDKTKYHAFYTK